MTDKPRSGGAWTEARFHSFITSGLRSTHSRWGPKAAAKREAWVSRGVYKCAVCGKEGPATLPPLEGRKRRRNNAAVDHIEPVVDPAVGFIDWNTYIDRMFVELDSYQVVCYSCHSIKTKQERDIATERRRSEQQ